MLTCSACVRLPLMGLKNNNPLLYSITIGLLFTSVVFLMLIFHRSYPYFFLAIRLACSNDPASYADGRVATSRVSHTVEVKCDDPDKNEYAGPPGWWMGERKANNLTSVKRTHSWEFQ